MDYQVQVKWVASQTTAVVRRRVTPALPPFIGFNAERLNEISPEILQACGEVRDFIRVFHIPNPGGNVAICHDGELDFECGVEVAEQFSGNGQVICSSTPAGMVATAQH